ncbi:MAG: GHMP kinase [Lentisphaeria bacterium]|nr:GHMP kinase [Lentisphaeria bacterium]
MNKETFFDNNSYVEASAPGRLDVIGGIADYSGSLVLEMPIAERCIASFQENNSHVMEAYSVNASSLGASSNVKINYADILEAGEVSFTKLRDQLAGPKSWALYPFGCALILNQEKQTNIKGFKIYIDSAVSPGKGVSASAAIEVASMNAMKKSLDLTFAETELAILCQRVENFVVGAPCGLMDQLSSANGRKDQLLPILCQPDLILEPAPIPNGIHFVGIDSGVRHSVGGASYGDVRAAAFMGYTIIATQNGISADELRAQQVGDDIPYSGYLANIPVSYFENNYRNLLPEKMTGKTFLNQFGQTLDAPITIIEEDKEYSILASTRHPIYENERVKIFRSLLGFLELIDENTEQFDETLLQLGELMFQAHASYNRCDVGNEVTDEIVNAAISLGAGHGIFGAKITGGGSGGVVCLLCKGKKGLESAKQIAKKFQVNDESNFFIGSSEGAQFS